MSQLARALHAALDDHQRSGPGEGPVAGWDPPVPLATSPRLPVFPVDALPKWMADQVAAVSTAAGGTGLTVAEHRIRTIVN